MKLCRSSRIDGYTSHSYSGVPNSIDLAGKYAADYENQCCLWGILKYFKPPSDLNMCRHAHALAHRSTGCRNTPDRLAPVSHRFADNW